MTLPLAIGTWAGVMPVGFIVAAVVLRITEHYVLEAERDRDLTTLGKLVVEGLSAASQAFIVAAGVLFAMLWGVR